METAAEEKPYTTENFNGTSSPLENGSSLTKDEDQICNICSNKLSSPRILSCLHIFCEACLNKLLIGEAGDTANREGVINCPDCRQQTKVGPKGAASLPCDYVLTNILDLSAIGNMQVVCTSCKTQETAVSRCSTCANFLCPNCNTAHQFMRCFENHHVVKFDDLKQSKEPLPLHKPVFCETHTIEAVKFYCYKCQILICNECIMGDHIAPEHHYERLSEAAEKQKVELRNLVAESKAKVSLCEDATNALQLALTDLQVQRDTASDLINETFQSYKALLEKRKEEVLEELKSIHDQRELKVMESFHNVEKTMECIEDACKFTNRLLDLGNAAEILALRRVVGTQLLNLINNTPKPDVNISIEFTSDMDKFNEAVQSTFGSFRKDSPAVTETTTPQQECSPPPLLGGGVGSSGGMTCPPSSMTSSPVSMPSSFEGDLFQTTPCLPPMTMIQEYNLTQLATLATATAVNSKEEPPSSNPSPTPSFNLVDLFQGDISSNALTNLQALAKLGTASISEQELATAPINGGPPVPVRPPMSLVRGLSPLDNTLALSNGVGYSPTSPTLAQTDLLPVGEIPPPHGRGLAYSSARLQSGKVTPMQVRNKFGQMGASDGQFNSPHGFCLGLEEDIIVADTNNHRIQVFDKNGAFKFQFGTSGKEEGQLWYPRKVAVMRPTGKFVICDRGNERSRMQLFNKNGQFLKKIAIRYIDIVAGLAVSNQGRIVAVDSVSPTVFIIGETGDLLSWFDCSDHMREPSDIAINGKEFFVCDFKGHCVVVFNEQGSFLRRIGCENITNFPNGIDISDAGDVLVGDSHGNRFHIAVFNREGNILCEFECPYVKVSRCCGLKITSEGYVVTLAKNNHHVLVLNTLYIV
ncbi:E3 ubiquitin-protein ligase meiotic P26 [Lycorma delicatula]|uniref:E3 ubiquitin-protein ligase meiotic P26 n=1 Tax=Lycorma delicatula TaxID=130591 RepID=UPI003F514989